MVIFRVYFENEAIGHADVLDVWNEGNWSPG